MELFWAIFLFVVLSGGTLAIVLPKNKTKRAKESITVTTSEGQITYETDGLVAPEEEKPVVMSDAYLQGYRDMAATVLPPTRKVRKYRDWSPYISQNEMYYEVEAPYVMAKADNVPVCPDKGLKEVALKMLDEGFKIDIEAGQSNREYMGGDEEDFKEYYKGGMAFIADVDEMKTDILDERNEQIRIDRIIEQRRRGLKEINSQVVHSMEALDELRNVTFSEETFEENWNRQMKEIESA